MTPPYLHPPTSSVRLTENCINREGVECLIQALQNNTLVKSIWCVTMSEETPLYQQRFLFLRVYDKSDYLHSTFEEKRSNKNCCLDVTKQYCNINFKPFFKKFKLHMNVTDPLCLSLLNWQAEKQQPQFRGSRGDVTTWIKTHLLNLGLALDYLGLFIAWKPLFIKKERKKERQ